MTRRIINWQIVDIGLTARPYVTYDFIYWDEVGSGIGKSRKQALESAIESLPLDAAIPPALEAAFMSDDDTDRVAPYVRANWRKLTDGKYAIRTARTMEYGIGGYIITCEGNDVPGVYPSYTEAVDSLIEITGIDVEVFYHVDLWVKYEETEESNHD